MNNILRNCLVIFIAVCVYSPNSSAFDLPGGGGHHKKDPGGGGLPGGGGKKPPSSCPDKIVDCGYGAKGFKKVDLNKTPPFCRDQKGSDCKSTWSKDSDVPHHSRKLAAKLGGSCFGKVKGRVDGCSEPELIKKADKIYQHVFEGACKEHDYSYHLSTKKDADKTFLANMEASCKHYYPGTINKAGYAACIDAAGSFYSAVVGFGGDGYKSDQCYVQGCWKDKDKKTWTPGHCIGKTAP